MSEKSGAFHIRIKKNWVSHILFVEKRGIPGSAEKSVCVGVGVGGGEGGGHSARISVLCHI